MSNGATYGQAWNVAAYPGGYAAAPAASYGGGGAPSWAGQYSPDLGKAAAAYNAAYWARARGQTGTAALTAGKEAGIAGKWTSPWSAPYGERGPEWWGEGYKPGEIPSWLRSQDVYTDKWRQGTKAVSGRITQENIEAAYPQLLQNPNVTPRVWGLLAQAKAEADIEMPNKPAGDVWTTRGAMPLDWFVQNIMTQNYTETQLRWFLGERETYAASEDPWEGGKITDPLTGRTTGWETTTVPTTKKVRGVSYETGEPFELTQFPWGNEATAYQQQRAYEETGERQGGGGKAPTWMIPSPGEGAPWARGMQSPQAQAEYWEAIQRGRLQPKDTKKLTPEEEAKLYARYGNIYELYQQEKAAGIAVEGGYYLTFDEWLEKTPEALALWDERQRRAMFPQPTATARWLPAKQRVR